MKENMTKVTLDFNDLLLSRALIEAIKKSLTLEEFASQVFEAALGNLPLEVVAETDLEKFAIELGRRASSKYEAGVEFHIDDLCTPSEWKAIDVGGHKKLGKEFRKIVESTLNPIARHAGRNSANKAIYFRI